MLISMKKICRIISERVQFCFESELFKYIVTLLIFIVFFYFGVNL